MYKVLNFLIGFFALPTLILFLIAALRSFITLMNFVEQTTGFFVPLTFIACIFGILFGINFVYNPVISKSKRKKK